MVGESDSDELSSASTNGSRVVMIDALYGDPLIGATLRFGRCEGTVRWTGSTISAADSHD